MLTMVPFQEHTMRASGKCTCLVALVQSPLERTRDRTPLATDRQRRALLIFDDLDHARVAAEPARGIPRDPRFPHLADRQWIHRTGFAAQAGRRYRQHDLDRRPIRLIAAHVLLRERHQRIGAVERPLDCILSLVQHTERVSWRARSRHTGRSRRIAMPADHDR